MNQSYSRETIAAFTDLPTASVADAVEKHGLRGYLSGRIHQIIEGRIVGPATTVREAPAEDVMPPEHALQAIDESAPGSVICIDAGSADVAVWGGLMTAGAVVKQLAGAVLDAGVRDVEEIRRNYGFPVYARGSVPATTLGRYRTVSLNEPIVLGEVTVRPGDLIVADSDGVVRVPAQHVESVLDSATEIETREQEQTKLILENGSLRDGLAKYNRI